MGNQFDSCCAKDANSEILSHSAKSINKKKQKVLQTFQSIADDVENGFNDKNG